MSTEATLLLGAAAFGTWFLLSGMEAGLFALNPLRLRRLAREGHGLPQRREARQQVRVVHLVRGDAVARRLVRQRAA
ncbi:MAG TPA: hypothetical protein PKE47_10205, partial [Verrucomicrobiota bacterium]|nr:hypothetical protein [Verrucomicrobiota bacterium]